MSLESNKKRVLLVSMPWGYILEPCLGVAILKAVLFEHGIDCDILEGPPRLLKWLKYDTYSLFSTTWALNDFLFTYEFEPEVSPEQLETLRQICEDDQDLILNQYRKIRSPEIEMERALRLRNEIVPQFLDDVVSSYDFRQYCMIGFTCLFDQTWASLALAKRIRRIAPDVLLAFGGYAIAPPVGPVLQQEFQTIDVIAYGDGEPVIVPLVEAACGERALEEVPNISYRCPDGTVKVSKVRGVRANLAESPIPIYDDWFQLRKELKEQHQVQIPLGELPVESSRGCWWGQKQHCIFCGIDDKTLRYSQKPADLIVQQLDTLHKKYGVKTFRFSDYIMPLSHYKDFLPRMAERNKPYNLHYETKANLRKEQLELCAEAGIYYLQPGIETFSTPLLKKMNKGLRSIQNIYTLYHMMQNGIYCYYNLIFGLPGDNVSDYKPIIQLIPSLYHLIPPGGITYPMVVRYSPLAVSPERFGVKTKLESHWRYNVIFSDRFRREHRVDMSSYCYYFDNDAYRNFDDETVAIFEALQLQIMKWQSIFENRSGKLSYICTDEGLAINDTRFGRPEVHKFGRNHARVYEFLASRIIRREKLCELASEFGIHESEVNSILNDFCQSRIVAHEDDEFTGIAFHETVYNAGRDWWHRKELLHKMTNRHAGVISGTEENL